MKKMCNNSGNALARTVAVGARTCRSLGHHLLHPLILRLVVLCTSADFEAQSSLLQNRLHPQIQIPNACPEYRVCQGGHQGVHTCVLYWLQFCNFDVSSSIIRLYWLRITYFYHLEGYGSPIFVRSVNATFPTGGRLYPPYLLLLAPQIFLTFRHFLSGLSEPGRLISSSTTGLKKLYSLLYLNG